MKKIYYILFAFCISFFASSNIQAASASISVSSNKNRVMVGETVKVTVQISSSSALGSWRFDVVPSNNLTLTDSSFGGLYIVDYGNSTTKSKTYTFTFKANASGTGSVSVKNSSAYDYDEHAMSLTNGSTSFKMMTYSELQATYSKNNNLSSLSIEGYEITPTFDKNTLEYSLEVENDVTSVKVNATKEDANASISGVGEVNVSEGVNPLSITVTAENGSTKTYKINVTVKELKPITVTYNQKEYTVIRKVESLPEASRYFKLSTITIDDEEVPSYINDITHDTLVGLKDANGNSALFLYDNGKYQEYKEYNFNQLALQLLTPEDSIIPKGYSKTTISIGSNPVEAYQSNYGYPLLYGMNMETGEKTFYSYDSRENTIQRYAGIDTEKQMYFYVIIGLFSFLAITYIGILIALIHNGKKKKEKLEKTMKLDKIVNETKTKPVKESKPKEKKRKKSSEEQENLLGKTMVDISSISLDKKE